MMKGKKGYAKGGAAMKKKTGTATNTILRGRVAGSKKKPMQTGRGFGSALGKNLKSANVGKMVGGALKKGLGGMTGKLKARSRPKVGGALKKGLGGMTQKLKAGSRPKRRKGR